MITPMGQMSGQDGLNRWCDETNRFLLNTGSTASVTCAISGGYIFYRDGTYQRAVRGSGVGPRLKTDTNQSASEALSRFSFDAAGRYDWLMANHARCEKQALVAQ